MQIQAINGISFRSNSKINNVSMPRVFKGQMTDTVSFGNVLPEANQKALNVVKEIFTMLTPKNPEEYKGIEKEFSEFKKVAKNIVKKVKDNLPDFEEAKFADYALKEDELEGTGIWASKRDGVINFQQFTSDGKFLNGFELNYMHPAYRDVKITSEVQAQKPMIKKALCHFDEKGVHVDVVKVFKYEDKSMNPEYLSDMKVVPKYGINIQF